MVVERNNATWSLGLLDGSASIQRRLIPRNLPNDQLAKLRAGGDV